MIKEKRLTPIRAIRKECLNCMGQSFEAVNLCVSNRCGLWDYRLGKRNNQAKLTPIKAIREFCRQCVDGEYSRIVGCDVINCKVREFRFGKNPARKGIAGNVEALKKARVNLTLSRQGCEKIKNKCIEC